MARFKIGDEVQMQDGTAAWGQYPMLHRARGRIIGAMPGADEVERITVEYPDGTTLPGVDAAMFKSAGS
ncbi:hypothetical protein [Aureimonas leprariae]|uniref:Hypervirulence associated protein TUDOR domain-containing protein n=1 Tax=Plantimonas leprariae TaxID=2615207 RepID=A0A7V7PPY5_9HYPH|nr:hypothetical protein [Aureimonas leprariae]KAB0680087.1 hypothetical protein F6X38_09765 [Aureimonas leprariae]